MILKKSADSKKNVEANGVTFEGAGLAIMSTYMLAQFLITIGAVERKLKKSTAIDPSKR